MRPVFWAAALVAAAVPHAASAGSLDDVIDGSLERAVEYLWSRQGEDGGWHSDTYAFFRPGEALTPFILHALLSLDGAPGGAKSNALNFIRDRVSDTGVLGASDPIVLEYPNYATAYALRCLVAVADPDDTHRIGAMRNYLRDQQFTEACGFEPASPVYGGWGFGGARIDASAGHMDLSYTRHVLQALVEAGAADQTVRDRAARFLQFVQKHPDDGRPQPPHGSPSVPYDGGFYFSPVVHSANKGGVDGGFRSYGTATCDGIVALHLSGVTADDPRMRDAVRWLRERPAWNRVPGVADDDPSGWSDALLFYHHAVRSEALDAMGWTASDIRGLADSLIPLQGSDGRFVNHSNHLMKENDPLLATSLAVIALSRAAAARDFDGSLAGCKLRRDAEECHPSELP